MRRLLARQYTNSVAVIFGSKAAAAASPPSDTALNGYQSIAASQLAMTDELVRRYEVSARAIAAEVASDPAAVNALAGCDPEVDGEQKCFEQFVTHVGRLAFRRPLLDIEVDEYVDVATTSRELFGTYSAGIEYAIVALMQSPSFLFQVEVGNPIEGSDEVRKLTGYEMASRMSLFLTDRGPDAELLDAAERGELDDEEGIRAHAARLVRTHAARVATTAFFSEYLVLDDIELMPKDPTMFPDFSAEVALSMRQETLELVEDVIWKRNAPITELLTSETSFIDDNLAQLYEVPAPSEPWTSTTLPEQQGRKGILSHAAFLAGQAHAESTSVTHRGMFVLERFMCTSMPPPPEGVVTELPPSSTAPTMRERVAVHLEKDTCRGCHALVDGMGLAMENFDPVGRWRDKENGETIDASGEANGLGKFVGVAELSDALAASEFATDCMLRNLYRHATGHVETKAELDSLEALHVDFAAKDFKWRELLVDLTASALFRTVGPVVTVEESSEEAAE